MSSSVSQAIMQRVLEKTEQERKERNRARRKRNQPRSFSPAPKGPFGAKFAKKLRKELRYHPSMPRKYVRVKGNEETILLHPMDPRGIYQSGKS